MPQFGVRSFGILQRLQTLGTTAERMATYEDLLQVPEHLVAEILHGRLVTHLRPAPKHAEKNDAGTLAAYDGLFARRGLIWVEKRMLDAALLCNGKVSQSRPFAADVHFQRRIAKDFGVFPLLFPEGYGIDQNASFEHYVKSNACHVHCDIGTMTRLAAQQDGDINIAPRTC